ncbi:MAG: HAMP domain-containing sensor histidine kinase [Eubacterium sp.]|nr:HAMP domain-containing sensor histidine kinase [Eubacterium sp.]
MIECVISLLILNSIDDIQQDTIGINRCLKSIETSYGDESRYDPSFLYAILDTDGKLLYKNDPTCSDNLTEAIQKQDTILDLTVDGNVIGKVLFVNTTVKRIESYKQQMIWCILITSLIQLMIILIFLLYLNHRIIRPFALLKDFAVRVAAGNLDLPLTLDRGHIFGSFTESFDLMRSELKKAHAAEKKANDEKKEIVAKLSHDIKTPVASIKSTSEIGYELAGEERVKELFNTVNIKSDQITTLVDNLFNASIQDITEITVSPAEYPADVVEQAIRTADYMNKASSFTIPPCHVFVDKLRLQQAFDNVFMNSYKYAGTDIRVEAETDKDYLILRISDSGEGVSAEELPLLKEKYHRGNNTAERDGAGLGLYLTDYYIQNMDGYIELASDDGFTVTFYLRLI